MPKGDGYGLIYRLTASEGLIKRIDSPVWSSNVDSDDVCIRIADMADFLLDMDCNDLTDRYAIGDHVSFTAHRAGSRQAPWFVSKMNVVEKSSSPPPPEMKGLVTKLNPSKGMGYITAYLPSSNHRESILVYFNRSSFVFPPQTPSTVTFDRLLNNQPEVVFKVVMQPFDCRFNHATQYLAISVKLDMDYGAICRDDVPQRDPSAHQADSEPAPRNIPEPNPRESNAAACQTDCQNLIEETMYITEFLMQRLECQDFISFGNECPDILNMRLTK